VYVQRAVLICTRDRLYEVRESGLLLSVPVHASILSPAEFQEMSDCTESRNVKRLLTFSKYTILKFVEARW